MKKIIFTLLLCFAGLLSYYWFCFPDFKTFKGHPAPWIADVPIEANYIFSKEEKLNRYNCDTPENIMSTPKECARCSNREMIGDACLLKCPSGQNRVGYRCFAPCPDGGIHEYHTEKCLSCDELQAVATNSAEECSRCANRVYKSVRFHGMWGIEKGDRCVLNTCPINTFQNSRGNCVPVCSPTAFQDRDGNCHACDELGPVKTPSEDECLKCPNRIYTYAFTNDPSDFALAKCCILKSCPKNTLREKETELCHSCYDKHVISTSFEECNKCPNRIYKDGYCHPQK
ncbi:MAG: hypothetical protein IKS41_04720 [Alphaproteobacteria bacterium]|nr:hypothetical protein [Alphaproteobacteria bacterium]